MIIRLFEYFRTHSVIRWGLLSILTIVLVFLVSGLSYKEDISDFLPLGTHDRDALTIYQDISGASQIIVIFDNPDDADVTVEAIEGFCQIPSSISRNSRVLRTLYIQTYHTSLLMRIMTGLTAC